MLLAYCGIDCHKCPCFEATQLNDIEMLVHILDQWSTTDKSYTVGDLICDGCLGPRVSRDCKHCWIKECATSKKLENCSRCMAFPCDRLEHEWSTWKVLSGEDAKKRLSSKF